MSIALVVVGLILLVMGFNATEAFASEVSEFFTGSPTDKAIWLILGGAAALVLGGIGLLNRSKRS
ncbi:MAG: DUF3185 family protein [Planctomycetota bacterium]